MMCLFIYKVYIQTHPKMLQFECCYRSLYSFWAAAAATVVPSPTLALCNTLVLPAQTAQAFCSAGIHCTARSAEGPAGRAWKSVTNSAHMFPSADPKGERSTHPKAVPSTDHCAGAQCCLSPPLLPPARKRRRKALCERKMNPWSQIKTDQWEKLQNKMPFI